MRSGISKRAAELRKILEALIDDPSVPEARRAHLIIHITGIVCALIAVQPIPFADIFILTPIQVVMVAALNRVLGGPVSRTNPSELVSYVAGVVGWGVLAQQAILGLYKAGLPFIAGVTTIPLVYSASIGLGYAAKAVIEARVADRQITEEELRRIKKEAESRAREESRGWNKERIEDEFKDVRSRALSYSQYRDDLAEIDAERYELAKLIASVDHQDLSVQQLLDQVYERLEQKEPEREQDHREAGIQEVEAERRRSANEIGSADQQEQDINDLFDEMYGQIEQSQREAAKHKAEAERWRAERDEAIAQRDQAIARLCAADEKKRGLIERRFADVYPSLRVSKDACKSAARLPEKMLHHLERQFGYLQNNPEQAAWRCTVKGSSDEVREIGFGGDGRIYVRFENGLYHVLRVGRKNSQTDDVRALASAV